MTRTERLIVLRIGADYRCDGWAKTPKAQRGWRLLLSPYDDAVDVAAFDADWVVPHPGGKWDAIHDILLGHPEIFADARLIWLPDDDLEAESAAVEALFRYAETWDLALCQPALTADSLYSHYVTVENPRTTLRFTNFVELMAPLMRREVLDSAVPHMAGCGAAKGLDFVWHRAVPVPRERRIAIVDAAAMTHRRPLGRHLESRQKASGANPAAEARAFIAAHRPYYYRSLAHGFLSSQGRPVWSRWRTTLITVVALCQSRQSWRRRNVGKIAKFFYAQVFCSTWQEAS